MVAEGSDDSAATEIAESFGANIGFIMREDRLLGMPIY